MAFELIQNIDNSLIVSLHGGNHLFLDSFVTVITSAYTWIPLYISLLLLVIKNNENARKVFLILVFIFGTLLISNSVNNVIVKPWIARIRPLENPLLSASLPLINGYTAKNYSFYSSHASNAFLIFAFIACLVRDKVLTTGLFAWAVIIGWTRLYLGVHYPSDVFVGMLMGCMFGLMGYILYFTIYKKISDHLHFISASYTRSGYSFADIDVVLLILVATYIYAAFRAVIQL